MKRKNFGNVTKKRNQMINEDRNEYILSLEKRNAALRGRLNRRNHPLYMLCTVTFALGLILGLLMTYHLWQ